MGQHAVLPADNPVLAEDDEGKNNHNQSEEGNGCDSHVGPVGHGLLTLCLHLLLQGVVAGYMLTGCGLCNAVLNQFVGLAHVQFT